MKFLFLLLLLFTFGCVHNQTQRERFDYCQQKYLQPEKSNQVQFLECIHFNSND